MLDNVGQKQQMDVGYMEERKEEDRKKERTMWLRNNGSSENPDTVGIDRAPRRRLVSRNCKTAAKCLLGVVFGSGMDGKWVLWSQSAFLVNPSGKGREGKGREREFLSPSALTFSVALIHGAYLWACILFSWVLRLLLWEFLSIIA